MADFDLHAPQGANKRKRIIGRGQGSGRGTTAGKGNKGQKARSGGKTYVGFEGGQMPLYRRLAHRGFSNYPFKKIYQVVNLGEIERRFIDGETVSTASLMQKGLVKGAVPVKVLGDGKFTKKLVFEIEAISASAQEKITKAGGSISGGSAKPPKDQAADV
ncbi:MAG: 50S ribosomal protein L15 [Spirochaetaceae bacterium]|jgi:large subunit ribosomal protein L15|nr:50S ribosomal protein L15 [Spirochaetaceae bacterium]